jgi:hypothetical protein
MSVHPEDIRDEMNRAADMARGLGTDLSVDDMRYYGERMAWAAVGNSRSAWKKWHDEEREMLMELQRES